MSTHKHFDKICCVVLALTLLVSVLFVNAGRFGVEKASTVMGYEDTLFDTSTVHTIDIVMDDWDAFLANCKSEEYYDCTVVIDDEAYKNVAIRGKGNTSLTQVESYGNDRYSFKIEFDHYDSTTTYHGLDKLCLNNIIQDNTYMKDYLTYQMMNEMGVASPLCSYVYITVNGEDWGLYLAVEGVEESFLQRNYGKDYGELYKPDSTSMGGGRGNGEKFEMDEFLDEFDSDNAETADEGANADIPSETEEPPTENAEVPDGSGNTDTQNAGGFDGAQNGTMTEDIQGGQMPEDMQGGMQNGTMPQGMPNGEMPENMQGGMQNGTMPEDMQSGQMPEDMRGGFQGGEMPDDTMQFGSDATEIPEDMTPQTEDDNAAGSDEAVTEDTQKDREQFGNKQGGMGGGGMMNSSDDVLLKYIDDEIESYANIFDNAKTDITDSDKTRLIEALKKLSNGEDLTETVDVEAVIRYFVVHNFVLNFDSYTGSMIHNYYLYEDDGQMQMIPWDYNLAFGGFQSMGSADDLVNYPIDSPVSGGSVEDRPMIAWIFANEEYTELYHQYFAEFINEYFDSGYFETMIDEVTALIAPYVEKDPTKFCTYEEFETGAATLKEFCLLRAESVSGQLDGSIGSTSDTQDSASLVSAGDLQISDMGSMNNSMGGGMSMPEKDASEPANGESSVAGTMSENGVPELPDGEMPTMNEMPEDGMSENGDMQKQGMPSENREVSGQGMTDESTWLWLGISVGILALGLGIAAFYKRR